MWGLKNLNVKTLITKIKIFLEERIYICMSKLKNTDNIGLMDTMTNCAEKDAVRWCHLTHQFIAGASVHSREPSRGVYPYFVSKRFINHSILTKSCQTCPAHIVMCHN